MKLLLFVSSIFLFYSTVFAEDIVGSISCGKNKTTAELKQIDDGPFEIQFNSKAQNLLLNHYVHVNAVNLLSGAFSDNCENFAALHTNGISLFHLKNAKQIHLENASYFKWLDSENILITFPGSRSSIRKYHFGENDFNQLEEWNIKEFVMAANLKNSILYFTSQVTGKPSIPNVSNFDDTFNKETNFKMISHNVEKLIWTGVLRHPDIHFTDSYILLSGDASTRIQYKETPEKNVILSWQLKLTTTSPNLLLGKNIVVAGNNKILLLRTSTENRTDNIFLHDLENCKTTMVNDSSMIFRFVNADFADLPLMTVHDNRVYFAAQNVFTKPQIISLSLNDKFEKRDFPSFFPEIRPYKNSLEQTLDAYFFVPPNLNFKAIIVHIHGGNCTMRNAHPEVFNWSSAMENLYNAGYGFYFINYSGDKPSSSEYNSFAQLNCLEATERRIDDVSSAVNSIIDNFKSLPVLIWGHSFGAYLANVLSTRNTLNVAAYISEAGIWNVKSFLRLKNGRVNTLPNEIDPIENIQGIKKPMLIAHGTDDSQVEIDQLYLFQKESNKLPVTIFIAQNEGHSLSRGNSTTQKNWLNQLLIFLKELSIEQ